jgi:flagellar biosynthetic protein FliR
VAPSTPVTLAFALAIEILVGLLLAFAAVTVFATVQFAGEMIGVQMGLALANVVDPTSNMQISTMSQVFNLIAVLIFLAVDGPVNLLRAFAQGYEAMPPGAFVPTAESMFEAITQVGTLFSLAVRIALLVVGFPIKILVGIFVVAVSVPLFGETIAGTLRELPDRLGDIIWAGPVGR